MTMWFEFSMLGCCVSFISFKRISDVELDPYTKGALNLALDSQTLKILGLVLAHDGLKGLKLSRSGSVWRTERERESARTQGCSKIGPSASADAWAESRGPRLEVVSRT